MPALRSSKRTLLNRRPVRVRTPLRARMQRLLGLGCLILAPLLAQAQQARRESAGINVVSTALPPFVMPDERAPSGALMEISLQVLKAEGTVNSVHLLPWTRAQKTAETQSGTVVLPLARTSEREFRFAWLVPLYCQPIGLLALNGGPADVAHPESVWPLRIGHLRDSPSAGQLQEFGAHALYPAKDFSELARMLQAHMIDAIYGSLSSAEAALLANGTPHDALLVSKSLRANALWMAGHRSLGTTLPLDRLRAALARMRATGDYQAILLRYHLPPSACEGELAANHR